MSERNRTTFMWPRVAYDDIPYIDEDADNLPLSTSSTHVHTCVPTTASPVDSETNSFCDVSEFNNDLKQCSISSETRSLHGTKERKKHWSSLWKKLCSFRRFRISNKLKTSKSVEDVINVHGTSTFYASSSLNNDLNCVFVTKMHVSDNDIKAVTSFPEHDSDVASMSHVPESSLNYDADKVNDNGSDGCVCDCGSNEFDLDADNVSLCRNCAPCSGGSASTIIGKNGIKINCGVECNNNAGCSIVDRTSSASNGQFAANATRNRRLNGRTDNGMSNVDNIAEGNLAYRSENVPNADGLWLNGASDSLPASHRDSSLDCGITPSSRHIGDFGDQSMTEFRGPREINRSRESFCLEIHLRNFPSGISANDGAVVDATTRDGDVTASESDLTSLGGDTTEKVSLNPELLRNNETNVERDLYYSPDVLLLDSVYFPDCSATTLQHIRDYSELNGDYVAKNNHDSRQVLRSPCADADLVARTDFTDCDVDVSGDDDDTAACQSRTHVTSTFFHCSQYSCLAAQHNRNADGDIGDDFIEADMPTLHDSSCNGSFSSRSSNNGDVANDNADGHQLQPTPALLSDGISKIPSSDEESASPFSEPIRFERRCVTNNDDLLNDFSLPTPKACFDPISLPDIGASLSYASQYATVPRTTSPIASAPTRDHAAEVPHSSISTNPSDFPQNTAFLSRETNVDPSDDDFAMDFRPNSETRRCHQVANVAIPSNVDGFYAYPPNAFVPPRSHSWSSSILAQNSSDSDFSALVFSDSPLVSPDLDATISAPSSDSRLHFPRHENSYSGASHCFDGSLSDEINRNSDAVTSISDISYVYRNHNANGVTAVPCDRPVEPLNYLPSDGAYRISATDNETESRSSSNAESFDEMNNLDVGVATTQFSADSNNCTPSTSNTDNLQPAGIFRVADSDVTGAAASQTNNISAIADSAVPSDEIFRGNDLYFEPNVLAPCDCYCMSASGYEPCCSCNSNDCTSNLVYTSMPYYWSNVASSSDDINKVLNVEPDNDCRRISDSYPMRHRDGSIEDEGACEGWTAQLLQDAGKLRQTFNSSQLSQYKGADNPDVAMIWSDYEAVLIHAKQISPSACGPTAVINVLKALGMPLAKERICEVITVKLRHEAAPLAEYLFSRSVAGTTADELIAGVEKLTGGEVVGRFFHFYPKRSIEILPWLACWIKQGAVPIATLNLQKAVPPSTTIPDAWHHQMIYGINTAKGAYVTNPLGVISGTVLQEQLCSESTLLVRRQDIVTRYDPSNNVTKLLTHAGPRWRTSNVLGQVLNVLREESWPRFHGYRSQVTSHVEIPVAYRAGVTLFARRSSGIYSKLLAAHALHDSS